MKARFLLRNPLQHRDFKNICVILLLLVTFLQLLHGEEYRQSIFSRSGVGATEKFVVLSSAIPPVFDESQLKMDGFDSKIDVFGIHFGLGRRV